MWGCGGRRLGFAPPTPAGGARPIPPTSPRMDLPVGLHVGLWGRRLGFAHPTPVGGVVSIWPASLRVDLPVGLHVCGFLEVQELACWSVAVIPVNMSDGLLRYVFGRLLRAALTIVGLVTLVFLLVRLIPGDPVDSILGDQAAPEDRAALRVALSLDRPLPEQYGTFVGHVFDGSLGESFRKKDRTVASLLSEQIAPTVTLALVSLCVAWSMAILLGVIAAARHRSGWDRWASTFAIAGLAIPTIWLGPLLILAFGVKLRWFPLPGDEQAGWQTLVLPALTIGTALAAMMMRQTRGSMLETLEQPYILAARARGLSEPYLLIKHALRNALLPVMTVGAAQLSGLLSGLVVAEKIFERRGLGTLLLDAAFNRDYPVVQGCVLLIGGIYVIINLAVDLLYGAVDPRVRLS